MSEYQLRVDWPSCKGHGLCAEILPEVISLDEWGYPIMGGSVKGEVLAMAKSAVKACPTLALRLTQPPPRPA
jgi:ferredoxin